MPDFKTSHVLIVDDEPDNLSLLQNLFNYFNAQVTIATNGLEAMSLLEKKRFDLILLDIQMPLASGEMILSQIRAHHDPHIRSLPVIAVTAHAMKGDRERFLASGFDDYVAKPFDVQAILALAQKHLKPAPDQGNDQP